MALTVQTIAGATVVLWLAGAAPSATVARELVAQRATLEALGARVFAVTQSTDVAGLDTLCDPEGRVSGAFGLGGPGLIVIDPEFRLAVVLSEDGGIAGVVAECRRLHDLTSDEPVRGQAPVLIVHRVLDAAQCRRFIDYWTQGEKRLNLISDVGGGALQDAATLKRRADVSVADMDLVAILSHAMARRIAPSIMKAFQREVTRFEGFRIGCYDAADRGAFGAHRDNATPLSKHRLFAVSLNLNADFAGGEVRFPEYGRRLYRPDPGDAVVFSCSLVHEALPVLSGRRFGIFTFLYDERGAGSDVV
jgi:predicted 2-oxoglutarate/Fe(II)-dependent dioxygenase YbiX